MTLEEVITEMVRLAGQGGAGLGVTLAVLLLGAVLVVVGRRVGAWKPKPRDESPPPPAEWNTDPANGAVVVPGPPGGTEDQNQAG